MSPLLAPDVLLAHFPPTHLVTTDLDPCLDETVDLAGRLVRSAVEASPVLAPVTIGHAHLLYCTSPAPSQVDLQVLRGLPRGFLGLSRLSGDCHAADKWIVDKIRDLILS